jgi:hypothetical protein
VARQHHAGYCVIVIVKAAVWLIAPVPLVEAVTETVLAPAGVPGLPGFAALLLLPHEVSPAANTRRTNMPKTGKP